MFLGRKQKVTTMKCFLLHFFFSFAYLKQNMNIKERLFLPAIITTTPGPLIILPLFSIPGNFHTY